MAQITRQAFIEGRRHKIGGMILDAATSKATGSELSILLRGLMRKVDEELASIYVELVPPNGNGMVPATTTNKKPSS